MNLSTIQILTAIAFLGSLFIAPIAFYRLVTAKSRAAYLKNMALFALPIGLTILLNSFSGVFPAAPVAQRVPPAIPNPFENMSTVQLISLSIAAILWLGGSNYVFYLSRKRTGRTWWQDLNPLNPPLAGLNGRERILLAALAVAAMTLMFVSVVKA